MLLQQQHISISNKMNLNYFKIVYRKQIIGFKQALFLH